MTAAALVAPAPAGHAATTTLSRVVVDDAVNPRAHIDLRRVTYRVGEKTFGVSAVVTDLPKAGAFYVYASNPDDADDSLGLYLERQRDGSVIAYPEYNFLEDAGGPIKCRTTYQWNRRTDVLGISVSRGCVTKFARSLDRPFRFDDLDVNVEAGTRRLYRVDNAAPVHLEF